MEARDARRLLRLQKQMVSQKLLIIDEPGFVPLSKTGAELLFELISQRYARGATLITSNLPFAMSKGMAQVGRVEHARCRRPGPGAKSQPLELPVRIARVFGQVRCQKHKAPGADSRPVHHQHGAGQGPYCAFGGRGDKGIAQNLGTMRTDHKQAWPCLGGRFDTPGKGVVQQNLRAAGQAVHLFQRAGAVCKHLSGILRVVIDDPVWLIVINHTHQVQTGTMRAGEDDRASQRPVGPF
jgi:hypothetical protein